LLHQPGRRLLPRCLAGDAFSQPFPAGIRIIADVLTKLMHVPVWIVLVFAVASVGAILIAVDAALRKDAPWLRDECSGF
jgi:hypothetical protein